MPQHGDSDSFNHTHFVLKVLYPNTWSEPPRWRLRYFLPPSLRSTKTFRHWLKSVSAATLADDEREVVNDAMKKSLCLAATAAKAI